MTNNNLIQDSNLAQYCNQWIWRSNCSNKMVVAGFFLSANPLDAIELKEQFMHTLVSLELIGLQVNGLCMDAGGGNSRLFKVLRQAEYNITCSESYFQEDMVSCVHPFDDTRRLYLFHCAAHVLKSIRNQLFHSFWSCTGKYLQFNVPIIHDILRFQAT